MTDHHSRHNLPHQIVVIALQFSFLLLTTLPAGLFVFFGLTISRSIFKELVPPRLFLQINNYLERLSLGLNTEKYLIGQFGQWFTGAPDWWTMIIGIPFILFGVNIFLINLLNLFLSVTNRNYNLNHCPFCKNTFGIESLSKKTSL